jgi:hypothetical protein
VNLTADPQHCGSCDEVCSPPAAQGTAQCVEGSCEIACATGYGACMGECVDFDSDADNCGGCGIPCDGTCAGGECCANGRAICGGACVDLESSAANCGECGNACAAGQVCEAGICATDCQTGERCGNDCVNLATDLGNCGSCGTRCDPPNSNGTAVCTQAGCDIACNTGNLRCAGACCGAAPANATTSCQTGACAVTCNAGYHGCNGSSSPCYPNGDAAHCGSTCMDCRQPNATAACVNSQCQNTCTGYTFPCPGVAGKPACGSWNFESATTEGWVRGNYSGAQDAYNGLFTTRTRGMPSSRALVLGHAGDGVDTLASEIKIRLCPSGQALNLSGRTLTLDVYAETTGGTPFTTAHGHNYFLTFNGTTLVSGTCDFDMASDRLVTASCEFYDTAITDVSLLMRVFAPWQGTFYFDNIRFQ